MPVPYRLILTSMPLATRCAQNFSAVVSDSATLGSSVEHHDTDRFAVMRNQSGPFCIAPTGDLYHLTRGGRTLDGIRLFNDVETVFAEKERVFPERLIQRFNRRVVFLDSQDVELILRLVDP
jgi:hypothetical protein